MRIACCKAIKFQVQFRRTYCGRRTANFTSVSSIMHSREISKPNSYLKSGLDGKLQNSSEMRTGGCCRASASNQTNHGDIVTTILTEMTQSVPSNSAQTPTMDAHCHLQLDPLYRDYHRHIATAASAGVTQMSVCGTCPGEDWLRVEEIYTSYPDAIVPSFGLHPWWIERCLLQPTATGISTAALAAPSASTPAPRKTTTTANTNNAKSTESQSLSSAWESELESFLQRHPTAGVGECGLDKGIKRAASMAAQEDILVKHLRLAARYSRPVTLHCVGSWGQLFEVLKTELPTANGGDGGSSGVAPQSGAVPTVILHSCNSLPVEMIVQFNTLPTRVYYSLSGGGSKDKSAALIKSVPLTQLLIETDSPDQLPAALKDRGLVHNEPCFVRNSILVYAEVLGVDCNKLARIVGENALRAFCVTTNYVNADT